LQQPHVNIARRDHRSVRIDRVDLRVVHSPWHRANPHARAQDHMAAIGSMSVAA